MSTTTTKAAPVFVPAGPPAAQPMPGLSKRAQELLDPRKHAHLRFLEIPPAGSGIAQQAMKKTSI